MHVHLVCAAVLGCLLTANLNAEIPRTADGKPDLTGTFDASTLTPLERPEAFGDRLYLTPEEADSMFEEEKAVMARGDAPTDASREAPPVGGASVVGFEDRRQEGESLGAGNVGAYNTFWFDRGEDALLVDGKFRTSIITDPPNGRQPDMHPEVGARFQKFFSHFFRNNGTAWWLNEEGPGPYDDIEQRPTAERCLIGFVEGPPMVPALYNNFVRVVQNEDHVMIMNEMIHDVRIVRIDSEHWDAPHRRWLGDSIGHWEDDTLVIETQNFRDETGLTGASRNMKLVERLQRLEDGNLHYSFTVNDPTVWTATWSGDFIWRQTDERIYEYACHEGNYAMAGIMKGARLLEQDALVSETVE